ncbi:MAG: hypothetical protein LQ340_004906 [Diploschistes diacapsis]|nr:MAG: hypothetical protein LQ340_004906 [Diploschistes diacapsis]
MTKVPFDLTHLNTAMRRIDIVCKLCAPLAVAPIISAISPAYSVVVIGTFSLVSWGVERWCAHQVWARQPRLRAPKEGPSSDEASFQLHDLSMVEDENVGMQRQSDRTHSNQPCFLLRRTTASILILLRGSLQSNFDNLSYFFKSPLWIPALGVAMLHASVLNYGNTITTWLLNAGFSINLVTVARASGSVFEMGSTVVFPFAVSMLASSNGSGYAPVRDGPTVSSRRERTALSENEDDDDDVVVVVRRNVENVKDEEMKISSNVTDIAVAKIPSLIALFFLTTSLQPPSSTPPAQYLSPTSFVLLAFLSLSMLGRWTYDLSITQLSQTLIPASRRGAFAGSEFAVVSCFGLVHWTSAAIWHAQEDFQWLALGSFAGVSVAAAGYGWWCRWSEGREGKGRRTVVAATS